MRLLVSEEFYRTVVAIRQVLRAVNKTTVGRSLSCLAPNLGVDSSEFLPPFVPVAEYDFESSPPWRNHSLVSSGFQLSRGGHWISREALNLARAQLADLLSLYEEPADD